jgi:hypothetical protein
MDISPAFNGKQTTVCRIWCRANTAISGTLTARRIGWGANAKLNLVITAEDGTPVGSANLAGSNGGSIAGKAVKTGWYTLWITGHNLPGSTSTEGQPFVVAVKYTAGEM